MSKNKPLRHSIYGLVCFIMITLLVFNSSLMNVGLLSDQQKNNSQNLVHSLSINKGITINELESTKTALITQNHSECYYIVNENNIQFLNESNTKYEHLRYSYPVYLFSYGGSGNTVTRILLEYTTNIWTASIYHERTLRRNGFKGEIRCNQLIPFNISLVMIIKAHPEHINPKKLVKPEMFRKKCLEYALPINTEPVIYNNMSAIFIIRDPWKAMFSLYQFHFGFTKIKTNSHIRHILLQNWNQTHWMKFIIKHSNRWKKTFELMELMDIYKYQYIIIKYENLINLDHSEIAIKEMIKMLKYLYTDTYYIAMEQIFMNRMKCIFPFLMINDYGRLGTMHRQKPDPSIHLTFVNAYKYLIDNHIDIICNAWNKIKHVATIYSYQNLPGVQC